MFDVWIYDAHGDIAKKFDDVTCMSVLREEVMKKSYPEIFEAYCMSCPYIFVLDGQGEHFYPLFLFSAHVG